MITTFFSRLLPPRAETLPFTLPDLRRQDPRAVERACARLFSTDDGRLVLDHLKAVAFMRCYGADASESQIRFAEGQRALVAQLLRLIAAGRGQ